MTTDGSPASGDARPDTATTGTAPILNIANVLTMSRLLLVPIFLVALFWLGGHEPLWRWIATGIFVLASITDRLDGDLARRRGLVTDFGKLADPIADKALTGSSLVALSILGDLGWWVTLVIIGRELLVTALRFWVIRYGVIAATQGGKLKTLLQAVAIGLYLAPLGDILDIARWVVMGAALLVTVLTGLDYVIRALRLRWAGPKVPGPA